MAASTKIGRDDDRALARAEAQAPADAPEDADEVTMVMRAEAGRWRSRPAARWPSARRRRCGIRVLRARARSRPGAGSGGGRPHMSTSLRREPLPPVDLQRLARFQDHHADAGRDQHDQREGGDGGAGWAVAASFFSSASKNQPCQRFTQHVDADVDEDEGAEQQQRQNQAWRLSRRPTSRARGRRRPARRRCRPWTDLPERHLAHAVNSRLLRCD